MCIVNMIRKITRIAYKQAPEKGDKGDSGPIHRIRPWASGTEYMPGPGYKYEDFVYYNKRYYSCQKYIASSTTNPYDAVLNSTGEWAYEPNFNFLATGVFFVGDGEGWIFDEGVISHTSGKISLTASGQIIAGNGVFTVDKDGNMTAKSGTFGNLTIGSTAAGYPCLKGSVWYDDIEEHFIELSPEVFKLGARQNGEEVEVIDFMPYFYSDKYDRNDSFRIKMMSNSKMAIEGGMIAGLRPQVVVSSAATVWLGNIGGGAHPGTYILTGLNQTVRTLQTDGYQVGDSFTVVSRYDSTVKVYNSTQENIFSTLDNTSYSPGQTIQIPAATARSFHMVWTASGFILYK